MERSRALKDAPRRQKQRVHARLVELRATLDSLFAQVVAAKKQGLRSGQAAEISSMAYELRGSARLARERAPRARAEQEGAGECGSTGRCAGQGRREWQLSISFTQHQNGERLDNILQAREVGRVGATVRPGSQKGFHQTGSFLDVDQWWPKKKCPGAGDLSKEKSVKDLVEVGMIGVIPCFRPFLPSLKSMFFRHIGILFLTFANPGFSPDLAVSGTTNGNHPRKSNMISLKYTIEISTAF